MGMTALFVGNVFVFLGVVTLTRGKTLVPNSDPESSNITNNINSLVKPTTATSLTTPLRPVIITQTTDNRHTNNMPIMAQNKDGGKANTAKSNVTVTAAKEMDDPKKDGLPLWAYILIGVAGVVFVALLVIIAYAKFVKWGNDEAADHVSAFNFWKDHGTYMVWDDAELETSPAFTRESEFLLETQTGGQELNTPELQLYEIPLDSVTHPKITYIGAKRVAPKKQEDKRRSSKELKRKEGEYHTPSLTRYTKRDTVYNSVTDTCITSVLSEGTLDGNRSPSSQTLATVVLSNGGLDKYGSTSHFDINDTADIYRGKSHSIGNRARSVSNLIQCRPLPAVPINKRFSKSLDKFRFFHTLPVMKHDAPRAGLLSDTPPYSNLVKSASYGSNLHRTVNNNLCIPVDIDQPLFATRKSSLDMQVKIPPNRFCHRKSKSLDTLTLLKGIDFNPANVDIYHSYESLHNTDAEYASVSDSQPNSPTMLSDYSTPQQSPTKTTSPTHTGNLERESIYASVNHEKLQRKVSQDTNDGSNLGYDSSTLSSVSSDATSPYASVRISQIPGLSYDHCGHEEIYSTKTPEHSGESFETATPENSGSSAIELKPAINSARSSTHTYIELFPEQTNRDSLISETSSGYARPVDVINGLPTSTEPQENSGCEDTNTSKQKSLTDISIPVENDCTFSKADTSKVQGTNSDEVYDNPVSISDDIPTTDKSEDSDYSTGNIEDDNENNNDSNKDAINLEDSVDDVHINIRPLLKRTDSDHSECEI